MERVTYISAGAGSGKTYTLTHLLAEHIAGMRKNKDGKWEPCEQVDPEKVILTTYTKKAAAEFREKAKSVLYEEGRNNPILYEAAARLGQSSIGTVHAVAHPPVALQNRAAHPGGSPQLRGRTEAHRRDVSRQHPAQISHGGAEPQFLGDESPCTTGREYAGRGGAGHGAHRAGSRQQWAALLPRCDAKLREGPETQPQQPTRQTVAAAVP